MLREAIADTRIIPLYQVSRWAQAQPFDALLLRPGYWPRFVEVRTNQWGVSKLQTRTLSQLPGDGYFKQIWLFKRGCTTPLIRQWDWERWVYQVAECNPIQVRVVVVMLGVGMTLQITRR